MNEQEKAFIRAVWKGAGSTPEAAEAAVKVISEAQAAQEKPFDFEKFKRAAERAVIGYIPQEQENKNNGKEQ